MRIRVYLNVCVCVCVTHILNSSLPTAHLLCSKTSVFVSWSRVYQRTHILCMLLGTRGHVVDELSGAAKVCTLSSPLACKKNGSFTFFFWAVAPLKDKWQPPPPLCGQVAMLLAFAVGRHIQKRSFRKDSSPFWTSCLFPFSRWVSLSTPEPHLWPLSFSTTHTQK